MCLPCAAAVAVPQPADPAKSAQLNQRDEMIVPHLSPIPEAGGTSPPSPWIVGVDEVGRGCLFGPVVAAAVILPNAALLGLGAAGLTDSKALSHTQREALDWQIRGQALGWALGLATVAEIDRLNILQASLLAMKRAVQKLSLSPQVCWVDGNQPIPGLAWPQRTIVNGDRLEPNISAASILAKVWRDRLMARLAERYPGYGLEHNKGYGTRSHRAALEARGITPLHRRSFAPCRAAIATQLDVFDTDGAALD